MTDRARYPFALLFRGALPLVCAGLLAVAPAVAQIIPPDRLVPWDPGVRGGIPWVPFRVDATDFGAVGDGVADDGPAFNAAIAAAEAPGFVWVPPGIYRIATVVQLADGIVLQGRDRPAHGCSSTCPASASVAASRYTAAWEARRSPSWAGISSARPRSPSRRPTGSSPDPCSGSSRTTTTG